MEACFARKFNSPSTAQMGLMLSRFLFEATVRHPNPKSHSTHCSSSIKKATAGFYGCLDTTGGLLRGREHLLPFPREAATSGNGTPQLYAHVCIDTKSRRPALGCLDWERVQDSAAEAPPSSWA